MPKIRKQLGIGDRDSTSFKPIIHFEQLEPRIMLSGDGLLSTASIQDQETLIDNHLEVVQEAELLHLDDQIEEQINQEPGTSDTTDDEVYQPICTLLLGDENSNELASEELNIDDCNPAPISDVLAVLPRSHDDDIDSIVFGTQDESTPLYENDTDSSIEYAASIEIRGPPATEIITLPGMHLDKTTVNSFDGQIVYLDFNGEEHITYNGPVTIESIDIPVFMAPGDLAEQEQAIIAEVLGSLEQVFTGSGIIFTAEQPSGNHPYSTIYIGGDDSAFTEYGSFLGLAEQVDVGNQDLDDKSIVFSENIGALGSDLTGYSHALASVIAHEVGHLLGYAHNHYENRGVPSGDYEDTIVLSSNDSDQDSYQISLIDVAVQGTYNGGDGSLDDPFQINTPVQMDEIGQHWEDWSSHFILTSDIDLAGYTDTAFNIIGTYETPFTGSFDGNGHTISNFTYSSTGVNDIGLFGCLYNTGEIKDLVMINVDVDAGTGDHIGGLVGFNNWGTVSNSYIASSVIGNNSVGGLVGYNSGTVSNCQAAGSVTGNNNIGGLVGFNNWGTVSNSYATGNVTAYRNAGGLVGRNDYGTISNCYATGDVTATQYPSGLVAYNYAATVSNCYAIGSVTGTGSIGGLVAWNSDGDIFASFWDTQTTNQGSGVGYNQGSGTVEVYGQTTAEMQMESTFTDYGWDFVNIWGIDESIRYPYLSSGIARTAVTLSSDHTIYTGPGDVVTLTGVVTPRRQYPLQMSVLHPDGTCAYNGELWTDDLGNYQLPVTVQEEGPIRVEVSFRGNAYYRASGSETIIPILPEVGMAIVVAGNGPSSDLFDTIEVISDTAVNTFRRIDIPDEAGHPEGNRIWYLHPDTSREGVDAEATVANLEWAIETWAAGLVQTKDGFGNWCPEGVHDTPLTIYLIGDINEHPNPWDSEFVFDIVDTSNVISASALGTLLDNLEDSIRQQFIDAGVELSPNWGLPINVIIEGPTSGDFIGSLSKSHRVIITSTDSVDRDTREGGVSYISADGSVCFSYIFFSRIAAGQYIQPSFAHAYYEIASNPALNEQKPQLEATGNGIANENADEIATGTLLLEYWPTGDMPPRMQNAFIDSSYGWVYVNDVEDSIASVEAVVIPPEGSFEGTCVFQMEPDPTQLNRWEVVYYDVFSGEGIYTVFYTAIDEAGNIAYPITKLFTVSDSLPPADVMDLCATTVSDDTVILKWRTSESEDTQGYKIYVTPPVGEELLWGDVGNVDQANITDLSTIGSQGVYTFRVTAYDRVSLESSGVTTVVSVIWPLIFVDAEAPIGGDGKSWATAYKYLQDALNDPELGNCAEIWVAAGTYRPDEDSANPTGTGDRTATFQLASGVNICGGFPSGGADTWANRNPSLTILSGDLDGNDVEVTEPSQLLDELSRAENSYHVVTASGVDASAVLDGFTIIGGNANGSYPDNVGGGMYNVSSNPGVYNCIFSGNSSAGGGGMYNDLSSPVVRDCTFSGNSASPWGSYGGGMSNWNSNPSVLYCTFIGNSAGSGGGGIKGGNGAITNSIFTGNTAGNNGGGIAFSNGPITNCIFIDNSANSGGGIAIDSSAILTNCTFSGNSATSGGAIYNDFGSATLTNCILWSNIAQTGPQIYNDGMITITYSTIQGGWGGTGNIDANPLLDTGFQLRPGSPCIDAGDNTAIDIALDLDGNLRFKDDPFTIDTGNGTAPIVDMGAYEFPNTPTGSIVTVYPLEAMTWTQPLSITFTEVTEAGVTSLSMSTSAPEPPIGFVPGDPEIYYNISTTATYNGDIEVSIDYSRMSFTGPPEILQLYHYDNSVWTDCTDFVDVANEMIYGTVTSLSPFAVFEPNQPPTAEDDEVVTDEDMTVTIDVLFNDSDVNGDVLIVTGVTVPGHGTAVINSDNTITYSPEDDYYGMDSFSYTVSDGNGGTDTAMVTVTVNGMNAEVMGMVWEDFNNDGEIDFGEKAIENVSIILSGIDDQGTDVYLITQTDTDGIYLFYDLRPGNYTITEEQPVGFEDGQDTLGTVNGTIPGDNSVNDVFSGVILTEPDSIAVNYNFGERPTAGSEVMAGQTATIGFWQNKIGQDLIRSLNGGPDSTQLGDWLAATFPNMYGANAGDNDLTGMSNIDVADFYSELFRRKKKDAMQLGLGGPTKMDAQVIATALAVYVTNSTLAGTTATSFGFMVTEYGVGISTFNVGFNGYAFDLEDNSEETILNLLFTINNYSVNGILYDHDGDGDTLDDLEILLRVMVNDVFSAINEQGEI